MFCFIGTGFFLHRHAAPFLTFRRSGSVPAVRKEKRMYFDVKEFGKRLHDVRTFRGITQEELAVRLGLASKHHMPRWETDEAFFDKIRRYGIQKG